MSDTYKQYLYQRIEEARRDVARNRNAGDHEYEIARAELRVLREALAEWQRVQDKERE